jgi:hypothetical protein
MKYKDLLELQEEMLRVIDMKYGDPIFPQLWKDENVKTFSVTPG